MPVAGQGCEELETSPVAALLWQGLTWGPGTRGALERQSGLVVP